MNYSQTTEFLSELQKKKGMIFGLDNMKNAFADTGYDIKTIQVAGTNGKGSVAFMLSKVLIASGYKVGLYMSPAIENPLDIIKVNNRQIGKRDYTRLFTKFSSKELTAFELETCIAFAYFKEKECDICVIECGLGGSLDATNVVSNTIMSVIVSVGFDHMRILGNTLEEIALNKAGIIKPGAIAYCGSDDDKINNLIKDYCISKGASFMEFDHKLLAAPRYEDRNKAFVKVMCQGLNTLIPLKDMKYLSKCIDETQMPCRYERLCDDPVVMIDGAHNKPAIDALLGSLKSDGFSKVIFVMGVFADKDYEYIVKATTGLAYEYICVDAVGSRNLGGEKLRDYINVHTGCKAEYYGDLKPLCERILKDKKHVYVVTGSLSYLGRFKNVLKEMIKSD